MAYTEKIDTSLPAGTDDPSEADDNMRRIQAGFQEILDVEHNADLTGTEITGDGKHKDITCDSIASAGDSTFDGHIAMKTAKTLTCEAIKAVDASGVNFYDKDAVKLLDLMDGGKVDSSESSIISTDTGLAENDKDLLASQKAIKTYVDNQVGKAQMKADNVAGAVFGAGSESVTLANGMIIKSGFVAHTTDDAKTITFDSAFTAATTPVITVTCLTSRGEAIDIMVYNVSNTQFTAETDGEGYLVGINWIAIGY